MTAEEFQARARVFRNRTAVVALILFCSIIAVMAASIWVGVKFHGTFAFFFGALLGPIVLMILALCIRNAWLERWGWPAHIVTR
jgi:hypothetical protein